MGEENFGAEGEGEVRHSAKTWRTHPRSFVSSVPVVGSLIAAFRQSWYNVAARWQDQLILDQQSQLRAEIAELRQNQAYLNHLLYERGLEISMLAEKLAQIASGTDDAESRNV